MKKWKKAALIVLLAVVLLGLPLFACSPGGAAAAFALNRAAFVRAAEEALAAGSGEDVKRPAGAHEIHVWPNPYGEGSYVDFEMGGAGMGPSTSYWGVTFSRGGPVGFGGEALNDDLDGWHWKEPDGDNWSRVTRLEENWYLYEMHF